MMCRVCQHDESKHCKGNIDHANQKDSRRMVANPKTQKCLSRHCLEPLCSCHKYELPVRF